MPYRNSRLPLLAFITVNSLLAILLSIIPLPEWALMARPACVALLIIYCGIYLTDYQGLGLAWSLGLLLDVLYGSVLGQHALALLMVAYMTQRTQRQLRAQPQWQQWLSVLTIITLYQLILLLIRVMTGHPTGLMLFILPMISSLLVWPLLLAVLTPWSRRMGTI